ncbi:MAG TPA: TonB-dependent receptor [Ideonella sp.]|uniref:TonB-dependent receptor plug domain-containing protein n=1 Tax=Ideonella sp. TaxID=1929293 RepID=UPI002E34D72F|nr:TonB-dependent receptor [Ideonella sp.]HEX5683288.1 TonB-dependent receptor [Ideonella sp.]
MAFALCGAVDATAQSDPRLGELSLEDLGNLQITSVSKRAERLADAPTSVYVITTNDIRRSGATSLPEALRLAPNLQVARSSASEYVVSARGFAGNSANKMLVLVDGRSVYTPLYSGVFWDVQDLMLEDVDRIEVISGPGSTLWGTNAVNGVINIITRDASSTQGSLATASAGTDGFRANLRHGASTAGGMAWRVYATHADLRNTETAEGTRVDDSGHQTQIGFRLDDQRGADRFMLRGAAYQGSREQPVTSGRIDLGLVRVSGAHVLGRWEHRLDDGTSFQLQAYVDHTERTAVPTFGDILDTLDLQFQHSPVPLGNHRLVWGVQYRTAWDQVDNSSYLAFLPARKRQTWASLFAQDDITLTDELRLTLGARAERNDYTGTEFLPTARLAWKWAPQQLVWSAVSRTVRAPSRLDRDFYVPGVPPYQLQGGSHFDSEVATVAELGYRGRPTPTTSFSATIYQADYDRLRTLQFDPDGAVFTLANGMEGRTRGVELWGSFRALSRWRLHAGYSRLWQDLRLKPGSNDVSTVAATEGASPSHWWTLRSSHDLGDQVDLDLVLRHVAALAVPAVPRYTALDLRVAWRPSGAVELALAGRNLIGNGHGEFGNVLVRTQLQRELSAQLNWRF